MFVHSLPRGVVLPALLGGCGHVSRVVASSDVPACAGTTTTSLGRPTWATTADIDRDGDADILLLDVHAPTSAGVWASVVPLRSEGPGYCRDAEIAAWRQPLTEPPTRHASDSRESFTRHMQLRTEDVDADGLVDIVVWSPMTHEATVLHGAGTSRPYFVSRDDLAPRPAPTMRCTSTSTSTTPTISAS